MVTADDTVDADMQRDDGASMYAAARARHNADAATQCVELADEALQDADSARAVSPSLMTACRRTDACW